MTTLHPSAWVAWLTAVAVFAFVVTNPFYLVLALGAVLVVHLSFPAESAPVARAVRTFLVFGVVLLFLRLAFVALLPNPGRTILVTVPLAELPRFLGALRLGGPVTAEVLVYGAIEGFRLVIVLAAFGVFNAHADVAALVRSVPAAFRDVGLVVSIALAFVPGMMRTVRDVRDAQRLRGERGVRRLAPSLAVPVLGLSLERALLLAESMDARGYGYGGGSRASRGLLLGGLAAMLASMAAWVAGWRSVATVFAIGGAVVVVAGFRAASTGSRTTRLHGRPATAFDLAVIAASAAVLVLVVLAPADATYDPYPVIGAPAFGWPTAALTFLLALPAVAGAESR
jgi:energy-coupling factor transport system permease protein